MDDVAGTQVKGIWERGRGPFAPWLGSPFCTAWLLPSRTGGGSVGGGTVFWHHLPPDCVSLLLDLFISILVSALPVSACPCLFLCMKLNLSLSLSLFLPLILTQPGSMCICLFRSVYASVSSCPSMSLAVWPMGPGVLTWQESFPCFSSPAHTMFWVIWPG